MSRRAQLCHPLGRHHPCTEGAAKAALTGAASELGIVTHSFTLGPQEILTTSPAKCEPGGEELKRTQRKVPRSILGHASTPEGVSSHTLSECQPFNSVWMKYVTDISSAYLYFLLVLHRLYGVW